MEQLIHMFFPVAATGIWNAMSDNVVPASSADSFRHWVKTFLSSRDSSAINTMVDLVVVLIN